MGHSGFHDRCPGSGLCLRPLRLRVSVALLINPARTSRFWGLHEFLSGFHDFGMFALRAEAFGTFRGPFRDEASPAIPQQSRGSVCYFTKVVIVTHPSLKSVLTRSDRSPARRRCLFVCVSGFEVLDLGSGSQWECTAHGHFRNGRHFKVCAVGDCLKLPESRKVWVKHRGSTVPCPKP